MTDTILIHQNQTCLEITMNRPNRKNALTGEMYTQLTEQIKQAEQDPKITSVLITGSEKDFTAGNDIKDFASGTGLGPDAPVLQFLRSIMKMDKILIAAVCGPAIGIGTTMLLHTDFVYAGDNAYFLTPFSQLGLVPEAASSLLLAQRIGQQRANKMLLASEKILAQEAKDCGLVLEVLPPSEVLTAAKDCAKRLGKLPPKALLKSKKLIKSHQQKTVLEVMEKEAEIFGASLFEEEAQEAFAAFLEKRKPVFKRD